MVLWKKLWYYGQNYGNIPRTMELRFTNEKKNGRLPKTKKGKKLWKYTKIYEVLNRFLALEL